MNKSIPHSKPFVGTKEKSAAARVITSCQLSQGKEVALLERELCASAGHRYGVAVSCGTAALYCALRGLDVGKGDRVIIPSYVCTALLNAVHACSATPVLCDVDAQTGNMNVHTVKKAFSNRVKAVIVPHMFGCPADAAAIESLGVPVVEDCAQCVGARIDGRKVGSLTALSVFSFYSTKLLAAGEGGLVATSNKKVAARIADMRDYDKKEDWLPRFNFKLSDIHAAIARQQLKKLKAIIAARRKIAAYYSRELLAILGSDALPVHESCNNPVYYRYIVRVKKNLDGIIKRLNRKGIGAARPIYKPLHQYLGTNGFPGTEQIHSHAMSIPIYPGLSRENQRRVISILIDILETGGRGRR